MQKTRDSFPDILRGFALLGIALVNIPYLSIDTINAAEGADLTQTSNAAAAFFVMALFQAKFYLLFSFLFGYSAHYILKDEKSNTKRWVGRSIGLIILGVLHFTLFFHGDILFLYGIIGLILIALYFKKEGTIRKWAKGVFIGSFALFAILTLLTFVGELALRAKGQTIPDEAFTSGLDAALRSGSFFETIAPRVELWLFAAPNGFLLQGPLVFFAFLIGVIAARKNALVNPSEVLLKKLLRWGLAVALPVQMLAAFLLISNSVGEDSVGIYLIALTLNFYSAPLLSGAYVAVLWRISQKRKLGLLSAAGKMSLTVYLSQSVIFSFIFSAWGLNQFGKLGVLEVTIIAALTWLLLAVLAAAYFKRFSKGPMEILLTSFSKLLAGKR